IVPPSGPPFATPGTLTTAYASIPDSVRSLVDRGQIAYAWQPLAGRSSLVVAGRVSGTGPAIYFIRDTTAIDDTLAQLRFALRAGGTLLALVAVVAARQVARGGRRPDAGARQGPHASVAVRRRR